MLRSNGSDKFKQKSFSFKHVAHTFPRLVFTKEKFNIHHLRRIVGIYKTTSFDACCLLNSSEVHLIIIKIYKGLNNYYFYVKSAGVIVNRNPTTSFHINLLKKIT